MPSVIITACLAAIVAILAIFAIVAGGYFWWRHKRSQLQFIEPNDEEHWYVYDIIFIIYLSKIFS